MSLYIFRCQDLLLMNYTLFETHYREVLPHVWMSTGIKQQRKKHSCHISVFNDNSTFFKIAKLLLKDLSQIWIDP